jgi:alkanesulfonate monooxygenase SsuD/methylene tetrahydromethanopterin reductase-like flavin-dependent oxidoreductase (luciferase family)
MGHYGDDGPQPVSGSAAQIAEHLDALATAGATHLQLVVDPITTATIDALGEVLAELDRAGS